MPGGPAADPGSVPGTTLALDARAASGGFAATRQLGFASDARAALMVCLHFADILVVAVTGIISYLIRYGEFSIRPRYLAHIVIGCVIFSLIMLIAGMCRFPALRYHRQHLRRLSKCWASVILLLIAIIYWSNLADQFSRTWILLWTGSGWFALMGNRLLAWRAMQWLRARGQLVTHIAVVGNGAAAELCAERLQRNDDIRVIGVFEATNAPHDAPGSYGRRDLDDLARLAALTGVDEIVVAVPCNELAEPSSLLGELPWSGACGGSDRAGLAHPLA